VKADPNAASLRVALASYDLQEIRVQKRYLEEQNAFIRCRGYQNGRKLLNELKQSDCYDVIVLSSQLEDMDDVDFLAQLRQLTPKPLLLLFDCGHHAESAASCLRSDGNCYMIKQTDLKNLLKELYKVPGGGMVRTEALCRQLYNEWGIHRSDTKCDYLTSALRIACAAEDRLAIRKEVLRQVGREYHVSVSAVDSGIRRMVDELEERQHEGWRNFKEQSGFGMEKPTTGKLIYAAREQLLARGAAK